MSGNEAPAPRYTREHLHLEQRQARLLARLLDSGRLETLIHHLDMAHVRGLKQLAQSVITMRQVVAEAEGFKTPEAIEREWAELEITEPSPN